MGPPQVGFSSDLNLPPFFDMFGVCYGVAFCFQVPCWMPYSSMGPQPLEFAPLHPLELTHDRHMCNLAMVIGNTRYAQSAVPSTALSRGDPSATQLSSSHSNYIVRHTTWGLGRESPEPSFFPCMVGRGLLFQVSFHLITWSTLNLWWELNMVILVW